MKKACAAIDCATGEVLYNAFVDDVIRPDFDSCVVATKPVKHTLRRLSFQTY